MKPAAGFERWPQILRAIRGLGVANVAAVAHYRALLRLRMHPAQHVSAAATTGRLFHPSSAVSWNEGPWEPPVIRGFGWQSVVVDATPPDWLGNLLTQAQCQAADRPWWEIRDFDTGAGDIKAIWELSRFDWLLALALQARRGTRRAVDVAELWLADWCRVNPTYRGPNWKCAQEASFRVLHLVLALGLMAPRVQAGAALLALLQAHLRRIEATRAYGKAQDNNHGITEAVALYVGALMLATIEPNADTRRWRAIGRRQLEERIARLIAADGSFSQYSVNYHRLVLDALSVAELMRRRHADVPFSTSLRDRAAAAARWLHALVNPETGDAPVLGHNDGANLLPLTGADYRDHRPAVALAATLFLDRVAYPGDENCDLSHALLDVARPAHPMASPTSAQFNDGGVVCLRDRTACVVMKYPRYRFRPSHADALHVDLWLGAENMCRDGGSYSYADAGRGVLFYPSTEAHCSVTFDGESQMPRLGRFLWGEWPVASCADQIVRTDADQRFWAAYRDWRGRSHRRNLQLSSARLLVEDEIAGFEESAVLRWRLAPGAWSQQGNTITNGTTSITIGANVPISRIGLRATWESRYYLREAEIPVLEVEVSHAGRLITDISWAS